MLVVITQMDILTHQSYFALIRVVSNHILIWLNEPKRFVLTIIFCSVVAAKGAKMYIGKPMVHLTILLYCVAVQLLEFHTPQ